MLKINLLLNTFQLLHITSRVDENSSGALKMKNKLWWYQIIRFPMLR